MARASLLRLRDKKEEKALVGIPSAFLSQSCHDYDARNSVICGIIVVKIKTVSLPD